MDDVQQAGRRQLCQAFKGNADPLFALKGSSDLNFQLDDIHGCILKRERELICEVNRFCPLPRIASAREAIVTGASIAAGHGL